MATLETLSMDGASGDGDESVGNDSHDSPARQDQTRDASFDDFPRLGGHSGSSGGGGHHRRTTMATMANGPLSLSLVTASTILHRTKLTKKRSPSRPPSLPTKQAAAALVESSSSSSSSPTTAPAPLTLLGSVPKDVLARDILGFLTDRAVKGFLDGLGDRHRRSSCVDLVRQFCPLHGCRLEDPATFRVDHHHYHNNHEAAFTRIDHRAGTTANATATATATTRAPERCCPECYATARNLNRCNGCKVFYSRFRPHHFDNNTEGGDHHDNLANPNRGFPGLRCQQCDRMAFCNACLSDDGVGNGCGSATAPSLASRMMVATALGTGPRRKTMGTASYSKPGRITCQNYCCPSVFTNTLCGEFICDDCGDHARHRLSGGTSGDPGNIETCQDCGKATCLDPNCLVCADYRLIHMSCKFSPDDAYTIGLGGILSWVGGGGGGGSSSDNQTNHPSNVINDDVATDLTTKLRKNLPDGVVWIFFLMALSKMWLFQQQHQQHLLQEL